MDIPALAGTPCLFSTCILLCSTNAAGQLLPLRPAVTDGGVQGYVAFNCCSSSSWLRHTSCFMPQLCRLFTNGLSCQVPAPSAPTEIPELQCFSGPEQMRGLVEVQGTIATCSFPRLYGTCEGPSRLFQPLDCTDMPGVALQVPFPLPHISICTRSSLSP